MSRRTIEAVSEGMYQVNKKRNRSSGGIGLGLFIVYGFAHRMGGFVKIESQQKAGTTIRVTIPQKVTDPTPCLALSKAFEGDILFHVRSDKYKVPKVRDFYRYMASNLAAGIHVPLYPAQTVKEIERLMEKMNVKNIFMGQEEYEANFEYFDELSQGDIVIAVSANPGLKTSPGSKVILMPKPLYAYPVVKILNEGTDAKDIEYSDNIVKPAFRGVRALVVDDEPMNLVTYSGNVNFSFEQTIPEVPAGQYRLSVYGFYRAGSAQDEANRVANGDVTHNLNMFAEYGDAILTQPIMNLYEGAAEEDVTGKGNHCIVDGYTDLFVPDGAVDSRDFYIAGYYRNDLIINITEAGAVKIGINHPTDMTYDGDYAPIGAWELYRLGDPEVVENQYFETEVEMEPEDWAGITLFDAETINEIAEYFGVAAADLEFQLVDAEGNTDVAYNGNPGEKIFWIDLDGNKKNWGNGNKAYIGYDPETPEIFIVQLGCADQEVLHTTVRLAAGDVFAEFKVTVNFAKPASEIAYDDLNVTATDTKEFSFEVGTQYQGATADVDIAAILEALEVETLDDLTIYAVEPDGYLNKSYNLVGSDGWRDNEGTPHGWGVGAYYYVKADFSRESAQIYEVGTMQVDDDHAYMREPNQFSCKFVFVKNNETHDAFELLSLMLLKTSLPTRLVNRRSSTSAAVASRPSPRVVCTSSTARKCWLSECKTKLAWVLPNVKHFERSSMCL